jgi:hypothetical protein
MHEYIGGSAYNAMCLGLDRLDRLAIWDIPGAI